MSTLSQIRSLVRVNISQTDETNTDFTNTELNGFINEGVRFLGALVKQPRDHVYVQTEDNKSSYTLPSDAILLLTAYFGDKTKSGDVRPMEIIPEEALKEKMPNWLDESGVNNGRPYYAVLMDKRTVLVAPTPNATESATGKQIHIAYVYQPSVLANDGDTPDLSIVYHDLVTEYAVQMCWFSKLNKPELGAAILTQVMDKAKKLENLIIKDAETFGFNWGMSVDPNTDGGTVVNP